MIVLVDWNWAGHHSTYIKEFALALLSLGHEVHAICPEPDEVLKVARMRGGDLRRLTVSKWEAPVVNIRPRRFLERAQALCSNRWLKQSLERKERDTHRRIDLVFFACLYDGFLRWFPKHFPWKWTGLYLHVRAFRKPGTPIPYTAFVPDPKRLFRSSQLHGLGVLDEGAVEFLRQVTGCENIVAFPDFADESPPSTSGVAEELKRFAGDRSVVGVAGFLQPTKGIVTLAKTADAMHDKDVVFAFVGELMKGVFSPEEEALLERIKGLPNVFTSFHRIPDESGFNGLLQSFRIVFAAYHDFPHSSNLLAKAAFGGKYLIVSEGYLMAERVRRFGMGEIIAEGDVAGCVSAIRHLLAGEPSQTGDSGMKEYLQIHSLDALRTAMIRLVGESDSASIKKGN